MTNFGIALVTAALQITLVALPAVAVIAWAARRSPRTGVSLAMAVLLLCTVLSVVAVIPLPHWWAWDTPAESVTRSLPDAEEPAISVRASETGGWRLPLSRLTALLPATTPSPAVPDSHWNVWTIVGGLFLAGLAVEAIRLLAGLWTVAAMRRRSVLVSMPDLTAEMDEMRREFDVTTVVAVRQSTAVGTAATIGWRRPVILLAADWPTWDAAERRAVLAHELAHVRRRDYLTSLLAAACRAAHFYHPLVRWLAARLRLHQELAADALAAAVAGGRAVYSQALARLALRQDAVIVAGMARPFLSDRTGLIRRVTMLRVTDDNRPLNRPTRWALAAMLGLTAFAASAVRGPAQVPAAIGAIVGTDGPPPFELSHVPARANCLVAFRPAAVLARPGMKPLADRFNRILTMQFRDLGIPAESSVPVHEIEQVVSSWVGEVLPPQPGRAAKADEPTHGFNADTVLIRMTHDFDWPAIIRTGAAAFKANVREVRPGLFRVAGADQAIYFRVVDRRTLCVFVFGLASTFDETDKLLGQLKPAKNPAEAWGPDWPRAQGAAAIIAFDNRRRYWTDDLAAKKLNAPAALRAALGHPAHAIACLDLAENATAHVYMTADESAPGQKRCDLEALAGELAKGLCANGNPTSSGVIALFFLSNSTVTRDGTTDIMELRMKEGGVPVKLARLFLELEAASAAEGWGGHD